MLLPSSAYVVLQGSIRRNGDRAAAVQRYHAATVRKGQLAMAIYIVGMGLTVNWPWLGLVAAGLVAALWILPWGPFDRLFLDRAGD